MARSEGISYRQMLISGSVDLQEPTDNLESPTASVRSRVEESRKELLDLGLRNPLLNYRTLRGKGVEIVGESAEQVFDTLVTEGRPMSFLPGQEEDAGAEDADSPYAWPDGGVNQSDRYLQTGESPSNLHKRLLNTFRDAHTSIEETGVNTLFLVLGMLRWYESDSSQQARLAPLVLVPVQLERGGARDRFTLRYTDDDLGANLSIIEKARADFGVAIPGQEALVPDSGDLAPDSGDVDATGYIAQVAAVVSQSTPDRWSVEPDRIALGFFSFNKLLMYLDLGESTVAENEIIADLFGDGFREPSSAIGDGDHLDSHLSPQDTYHVLDADSSQSLAIHDATGGRNLVIQGPPGTGKSQTITNIIATAVGRGQRALFVSEKMAALEVVKRRLDSIGLGDPCLELHSHKTNKRQTLDELKRALDLQEISDGDHDGGLEDLGRTRQQLNSYSEAVNTPVGNSGLTPHKAFGELLIHSGAANKNPIGWTQLTGIGGWSGDDFRRKREVVDELRLRLQNCGVPRQHPFYGAQLRSLGLAAQSGLLENIEAAAGALEALADSSGNLADRLPLVRAENAAAVKSLLEAARLVDGAPDLSGLVLAAPQWLTYPGQIKELLEQGLRWRRVHSEYDDFFLPEAWDTDLSQARAVLNTTGRSVLGRLLSPKCRQARRALAGVLRGEFPRDVNRQIELIDAISEERQLRSDINGSYPEAALALGRRWAGLTTDWDALAPSVRWWLDRAGQVGPEVTAALQSRADAGNSPGLAEAIAAAGAALDNYRAGIGEVQSGLDLHLTERFGNPEGLPALSFAEQRQTLRQWADRLPEIQDIIGFNNGVDALLQENLRPVVAVAVENPDAVKSLTDWFELAWYESVAETALAERPALRDFNGQLHEGRIERFRTLDRQFMDLNRSRVALAHRETADRRNGLPDRLVREGTGDDLTRKQQQQLRVLQREIEKRSRHKPIRQLIAEAGDLIQELKPVFMMSPLSIAKYLAPGTVKFDLVVFDEASQVRPVDALGALLRGVKAVVVGDSKQLPPTSFFDKISHGDESVDEESVTADIESVLGLFASQGAPSRQLRWHYRSRHESLIAVSNREFYDNNLVVFSSPDAGREGAGLQYHHLPEAVYDRGRSRTNPREAEAVARAVMEHAARNPGLTLGVAAFSQAQALAIDDRLETLRRQDPSVEEFFAAHPEEPFFVKNLENVQGDERDVIFISVGYGREENGRVYQNFGPLSNEGGERRLNVLITRAKLQCHVFTNLRAEDIDASGALGRRALRTFLSYAETGQMQDQPHLSGFEVDSPFQRAVAARLEECGYLVHQEVASGGRFVDIGIVDPQRPGRYIIGIECDGASYHSSRSARDRDRLREQVLRGLGWQLHRIWSTDWYHHPERELQRAVAAIEQAKSAI